MTLPARPKLESGRVYRTHDLAQWSANAPRLARRLVKEGALVPLARGLFAHPKPSRFGAVPSRDDELLRAFLDNTAFVVTGPEKWNSLGLGSTAVFAMPLVYNTKRSGTFKLGNRAFRLRRVAFPVKPTPEWFVVDLFENSASAGVSRDTLVATLSRALEAEQFNPQQLGEMSERFATRANKALIDAAMKAAGLA
jgi:hypothetical protein